MSKKFDSPETIALIKRASAGDHGACTEIYTQYVERTRAICLKLLRDNEEAEEATQDVFSTVAQQIKRFKKKSRLSTWIFRIAFNCSMMTLRRRQENLEQLEEVYHHVVVDHNQELVPERILLQKLIGSLTPIDKDIVEMRLLGYTHQEIAIHHGWELGFSKSRYSRAVSLMKEKYVSQRVHSMRDTVRDTAGLVS